MKPSSTRLFACAIAVCFGLAGCHNNTGTDQTSSDTADTTTMPASLPADNMASSGPMTFDQMDKNHDGSLTPDEIPDNDPLKQHFSDADTNGDGKLSADEVTKYRGSAPVSPGS